MLSIKTLLGKISGARSSKTPPPPLVRPPSVLWILDHRAELQQHQPASTSGDNPLASLYRMYEYFVAGYITGLRSEVEFFFNRAAWTVADIPDPEDPDPERYAILAVLPYYLTHAFNRLIERGLARGSPAIIISSAVEEELKSLPVVLEKEPAWVAGVPKLDKTLVLPCTDGSVPREDIRSQRFLAMNIVSEDPYIVFV